jgi:hypothetical protein
VGKSVWLLLIGCMMATSLWAQEWKPRGQFGVDSVKVGMPIWYSLAVKYPRGTRIVFPDSTYQFSPFEWEGKRVFPTRSDDLFSYDSAVYYVSTFEVDSVQWLGLPVFQLMGKDSLAHYAQADTVFLIHTVTSLPDSVNLANAVLLEDTVYRRVPLAFNYIYFSLGAAALIFLGILGVMLFGKPLTKAWKIRKLRKQHLAFRGQFHQMIMALPPADQEAAVEQLANFWKHYAERLSQMPYTKLTTKELAEYHAPLKASLQVIDKVVYGGGGVPELSDVWKTLEDWTESLFQQKMEELRNG